MRIVRFAAALAVACIPFIAVAQAARLQHRMAAE
jgi:hypothetical protein